MIAEEGLQNVIKRHQDCARRLYDGLRELGLELYVNEPLARLPTVTTIKVPENVQWQDVTGYAMKK